MIHNLESSSFPFMFSLALDVFGIGLRNAIVVIDI